MSISGLKIIKDLNQQDDYCKPGLDCSFTLTYRPTDRIYAGIEYTREYKISIGDYQSVTSGVLLAAGFTF